MIDNEKKAFEEGFKRAIEASKEICIQAMKFWDDVKNQNHPQRLGAGKQAQFLFKEIDRLYELNNIKK